jgi:tRNA(Ile)-lysidine synthase
MNVSNAAAELPAKLAAAWPAPHWRDVHVLAAVSGGADSMALLRAMLEVKQQAGGAGRIVAGHVNHQLRGQASDADEAWLAARCRELDVPLLIERCDTAAAAVRQGDGVEAAARELRYQLLTLMAERTGARFIATAHTRDDQVETVLFRLLRGTGLRGLAGMRRARMLSPSASLVRPLLDCSRAEVMEYLQRIGQSFRDDASNEALDFARNRIRRKLLPYLRDDFNTEVDVAVVRIAELAGEAQAVIDELAADRLKACRGGRRDEDASEITLSTAPLVGQPELVVCEVLRQAWRQAGWPEQAMTNQWWRKLAQFSQSADAGGSLNLPGDVRASRPTSGVLALRAASLS